MRLALVLIFVLVLIIILVLGDVVFPLGRLVLVGPVVVILVTIVVGIRRYGLDRDLLVVLWDFWDGDSF